MAFPPDELDDFPASRSELVTPTGVAVVTAIHENLAQNFRLGMTPTVDFVSPWRLAKYVVNELGPLYVYRHAEKRS